MYNASVIAPRVRVINSDDDDDEPQIYFERILAEKKQQSQGFIQYFKVSTKAQESSYPVA